MVIFRRFCWVDVEGGKRAGVQLLREESSPLQVEAARAEHDIRRYPAFHEHADRFIIHH